MLRRSPLRAKRPNPRRNEGRVAHERVKPKVVRQPDAAERAHFARIIAAGCVVCGSAATVHHVTSDGFRRIARSHRRVVALCPRHHQIQHGPRESVEALGHSGFTERYGIDLLAVADAEWERSCQL